MKKNTAFKMSMVLFLLVFSPLVYASAQIGYESASVGRIVGDTPEEMLKQLENKDIRINDATYYSAFPEIPWIYTLPSDVKEILNENYQHVDAKTGLSSWDWNNVELSVDAWKDNNLFIIESSFGKVFLDNIYSFSAKALNYPFLPQIPLSPSNLRWDKFSQFNPLLIFNSDYAGLHLPGLRTFVSELGEDSTIIAPSAFADDDFVKVFVCNLGKYEKLGKTYRNARNNYYWQTNRPSGLSLMSYSLYGNPRNNIEVPGYDSDSIKKYCEGYVKDYDSLSVESKSRIKRKDSGELSIQSTLENIYTYEHNELINDYEIIDNGNYSILDIRGYEQAKIIEMPVVPYKINHFRVPHKTVTVALELISLGNPIDIVIPNLAQWNDGLENRTCEYNYSFEPLVYSHSFTDKEEVIITQVNPLEIIDCEEGRARLYRNITYKIDFIPDSPVLIKSVEYPEGAVPLGEVLVKAELSRVKEGEVGGVLRISKENKTIATRNIVFDTDSYFAELSFRADSMEGISTYSLEFIKGNETKTSANFRIKASYIDAYLNIPDNAPEDASVELIVYNHNNSEMDLEIFHELKNGEEIHKTGTFNKKINHGWNALTLNYENLDKKSQRYDLNVIINYDSYSKSLFGSIITNHYPVLEPVSDIIIHEGQKVEIKPFARDFDYDSLSYFISEPIGNDGKWHSGFEDEGNYSINVSVSDGLLSDSIQFRLIVLDSPADNKTVVFRDCNYGSYRGGFSEIAIYDFDGGSLESWYQDGTYDEVSDYFAFNTKEGYKAGLCLNRNSSYACIEDSDLEDPEWGDGDSFPDPVFKRGGSCITTPSPSFSYRGHEVCMGNVACAYPACIIDSDCGNDKWIGEKYCMENNVYQKMANHTCIAGQSSESRCNFDEEEILLEVCPEKHVCSEGRCEYVECITDLDCGKDGYARRYCDENKVYDDYKNWECVNKGSKDSYCSYSKRTDLIEECAITQVCAYGSCVDKQLFVLGSFSDGDENKSLAFYIPGKRTYYFKVPKDTEIFNASVNIGGGVR